MKKQKLASKLNLKKITISKMDQDDLKSFVGGGDKGLVDSDVLCSNPYCAPSKGGSCVSVCVVCVQ